MEAFKKIPSSFGVLVRKPGLGGKLPPPPLATRGLRVVSGGLYLSRAFLVLCVTDRQSVS